MNYSISLALAFCTLGALANAQDLLEGHYLAGTQGWDKDSKPDPSKTTIQLLSPFTGEATMLRVTGIPAVENPATFFIETPASFLCGTKVAAAPAEGNLYRVQQQKDKSWAASKINKTKLGINASDMVVDGGFAYIIGSAIFGTTGDDATIMRVSRADGKVTVHAQFGEKWKKGGALGLGSGLLILGKTLHAFTFDSTAKTTTSTPHNEHWTISTTTPQKIEKLPDLPLSKRWLDRGYASRKALFDPMSGNIVVVGAWGELTWRTTAGKDVRQEGFPGKLIFDGSHWSQIWRGVAFNTDTYAFGLADHDGASIDERRLLGGPDKTPFANNVVIAVRPSKGTFTISGMVYVPSSGSYRTIGDGCRDGANGAPSSYASGNPTLGNKDFGLTLSTPIQSVSTTTIAVLMIGAKSTKIKLTPIAADCVLRVDPMGAYVLAVAESSKNDIVIPAALPSKTPVTVYTQWFVLSPKANALGAVLSDARELVVR